MSLSADEKAVLLWPIKAKGAVQRLTPLGDPQIEHYYHQALESGRHLEREIGSAQHWLLQKKKDLMEKISMYTHMNSLAVDGQLSDVPRAIKYVGDSIKILNDVAKFQQEIIGLITAITQNIGILQSMEANMIGMIQANLNALAVLLNEICNWGLPDLPAIPNLFSDTIWNWNGFNFFPLSSFSTTAKGLKFDANFAFNQCVIHTPNINIFRNYPSSVTTASGLTYGTTAFVPPLGGLIPNTGQDFADPNFVFQMQGSTTPPTYSFSNYNTATAFNPNSSMLGAVPDPSTIISNYQMPPATYQGNIVSIVPALRDQTIEPTDPDYANPNLTKRNLSLRQALVHYVTLEQVVTSSFDPNLTAAWLFYIQNARGGRQGVWIDNFQAAYTTYITPSLTYLANTSTPWNCVLPSTQINNAPKAIPLIVALTSTDAFTQGNVLWRLSYVEASLLGYPRAQDWDAYADGSYTSGFTGTDLDYTATVINTDTTTTIMLGETTAEYPTPCTFPSAIGDVLQEVIALAAVSIQNTLSYTTSRPQFKYIYDQFAEAKLVDRFTQFWREFNANLQALLLQDPYLVQFAVTYAATLDSAIDPLGDPTAYNTLKSDAATRDRSWTPGYPLLTIPKAPIVTISVPGGPGAGESGWTGTTFDPTVFLSRPDIQQLPIPVQTAMLRTNLSYAIVQQTGQALVSSIQDSIQQAQSLLADFQNVGFMVEIASEINSVPSGTGLQVSFDKVDFDITGNVTSPNTFTIKAKGNYSVVVSLNWGVGDAGVRSALAVLNTTTVLDSVSTSVAQAGPTMIQMSFNQYFNVGDVLTITASHGLSTSQNVVAGSYLFATLTDTEQSGTVGVPPNGTGTTLTFTADVDISPLTALAVGSDGGVSPIDPTSVQTDGHGNPIYPIVTGVSLITATTGNTVTVGGGYGSVYEYPASFTVGGLIYAAAGGALTQDYSVVVSTCQWVVVIGRAIAPNQFIFEPHIPNLMNFGTF